MCHGRTELLLAKQRMTPQMNLAQTNHMCNLEEAANTPTFLIEALSFYIGSFSYTGGVWMCYTLWC